MLGSTSASASLSVSKIEDGKDSLENLSQTTISADYTIENEIVTL